MLLYKRSGPRSVSDSLLFQTQVKVSLFCQTIMPQILVPSPPGVVSDCSGENLLSDPGNKPGGEKSRHYVRPLRHRHWYQTHLSVSSWLVPFVLFPSHYPLHQLGQQSDEGVQVAQCVGAMPALLGGAGADTHHERVGCGQGGEVDSVHHHRTQLQQVLQRRSVLWQQHTSRRSVSYVPTHATKPITLSMQVGSSTVCQVHFTPGKRNCMQWLKHQIRGRTALLLYECDNGDEWMNTQIHSLCF